jgi:FtsZ-binding cell division protein ZapB
LRCLAKSPSSEISEELELKTQTAEELKAKQAEVDRLTKENERLSKEAEAKAKADAERDEFVLTGSDRPADVAAAQGQQDIFAAAEEAPAEEQFTPMKW